MVAYDDEQGANVYVLANARDQASLLFDKAAEMVKQSPALFKKFGKPKRSSINYAPAFSKMEPRASDSRKLDGLTLTLVFLTISTSLPITIWSTLSRNQEEPENSLW